MVVKIDSSTDDYKLNKFKSHGRAEFERDGQILVCHATGPFNKELIQALAAVEPKLIKAIISDGLWADITILKESALATPEALVELGDFLNSLTEQGIISCASGLVVDDHIEGAHFIIPYIKKAFADTGVELMLFNDIEAAKEWALEQINAAVRAAGAIQSPEE